MEPNPERIPVIVGVGQVNDRPDGPGDGLDPVGLMAEALRRAERDGAAGLLSDCDSLAVVTQIGWPQLNPVEDALCAALAIAPAHREHTPGPNG
ncbi:MAG: acetyl-CoA acetyltransferase, partial [Erythrobacter sp.]|nr:acetyl-CoA acetyltransferase [Erythrobacter sp.]